MRKITSNEFTIMGIFLGVLASLMIFFPALVLKDSETSYTGIQIAFGHEFVNLGGFASGQIEMSFLNILAYLLPLCGALLMLVFKKGSFLTTIVFLAATVMLFLIPEMTRVTITLLGNVNEVSIDWTYGLGLIFAIVLSGLGLFTSLLRLYQKA